MQTCGAATSYIGPSFINFLQSLLQDVHSHTDISFCPVLILHVFNIGGIYDR